MLALFVLDGDADNLAAAIVQAKAMRMAHGIPPQAGKCDQGTLLSMNKPQHLFRSVGSNQPRG